MVDFVCEHVLSTLLYALFNSAGEDLLKSELTDPKKDERTLPAVIRWHEPCKAVHVLSSHDNWQHKHVMVLDKADRKNHSARPDK